MKVMVRRDRPAAAAVAVAMLVTAAMVGGLIFSARRAARAPQMTFSAPERVTRALTLGEEAYSFVTLGTFAEAGEARVEAARWVPGGSAGYLWTEKDRVRILGNVYETPEAAERAACRLRRQGISADVVTRRAPALELSLTATETQISAFLAARQALDRGMSALSEISRRLDAGEIGASAARTQALVAAYDLQTAAGPFIAAANGDAVAAQFCRLLEIASDGLRVVSAADQGEMYLSSQAKYAQIRCALARLAFLQGDLSLAASP